MADETTESRQTSPRKRRSAGSVVRAVLAGRDGPGRTALPAGEFLHPAPLLALVVLVINDHVLKGAGWLPGWATGKISDFAGLLFAPLLLTATIDCALLVVARIGKPVDFSLRPFKLWLSIAATGAVFSAIKLSESAADALASAVSALGLSAAVVADPTDLVALVALAGAAWVGRAELGRVPLGRLESMDRRGVHTLDAIEEDLADVIRAGGQREAVSQLATGWQHYVNTGDAATAEAALAQLRDDH